MQSTLQHQLEHCPSTALCGRAVVGAYDLQPERHAGLRCLCALRHDDAGGPADHVEVADLRRFLYFKSDHFKVLPTRLHLMI